VPPPPLLLLSLRFPPSRLPLSPPLPLPPPSPPHPTTVKRDETCPVCTGRGTRRVQLVREGGGGGRAPHPTTVPRDARAHSTPESAGPAPGPRRDPPEMCPISTGRGTRRVQLRGEGWSPAPGPRTADNEARPFFIKVDFVLKLLGRWRRTLTGRCSTLASGSAARRARRRSRTATTRALPPPRQALESFLRSRGMSLLFLARDTHMGDAQAPIDPKLPSMCMRHCH